MNAADFTWDVLRISARAVERLFQTLFVPVYAQRYFEMCNLPPLQIGTDWAAGVTDLRKEIEDADAGDPAVRDTKYTEFVSRLAGVIENLQLVIDTTRAESSDLAAIDIALRLFLPNLMWSIEDELHTSRKKQTAVAWVATALWWLVIVDERLQEAYPDTLSYDRWAKLLAKVWSPHGPSSRPEKYVSYLSYGALALFIGGPAIFGVGRDLFDKWSGHVRDPLDKPQWPFDFYIHNGFDDHPPIAGLEQTLESAQRATVIFFGAKDDNLTKPKYDAFDDDGALWKHRQVALAFVPRTDEPGKNAGGLYFQLAGDLHYEAPAPTRGFSLKLDLTGGGGVLFPMGDPAHDGGIQVLGTIGADTQLVYESPDAATSDDPNGVTFHVRRITVETGIQIATTAAASDAWGRVRIEQAEVRIGKLPVLEYVLTSGTRFSFDAGVVASLHRGVMFEGGVGGEVVIPLDLQFNGKLGNVPLASARVRNVHLKVVAVDTPDGPSHVLELTAALSVTLFGALTATVDGAGVAWGINRRDHRVDGNLAGIAHATWETVPPTGIGASLDAWILKGGGFFEYDATAHKLGGGVEIAVKDIASIKAIGVAEPQPGDAQGTSWLIIGAATFDLGWPAFSLTGLGMIYGSHRRADPDAFLASIASGGLDAVLFPQHPVDDAAAYITTLDRLFPPAEHGEVIGGMVSLEAFSSLITADVGVILDRRPDATSWYLLARIRLRYPHASGAVVSLEADGVAIWDNTRNEFQLRLVLRNSRLFGGDVAGELMVFRGDPDLDDNIPQHTTFVSLGGFHPAYTVPSGRIYVPKRLSMTWSYGDHIRFEWKFYLATTPGSFQLGISADLVAKFSGFGIKGHLGFDALFASMQPWTVSLELDVELLLGDHSFAGVGLKGLFTGTQPAAFTGRVSISFLFWSWTSPPFTVPLDSGTAEDTHTNVLVQVIAAAQTPASFEHGGTPGLALRAAERSGVWVSPSEPLRFRQHVVPLNRAITRFGDTKLDTPATFAITAAPPPGVNWTTASLDDEFAPLTFLDLTREQALAARGFESMPAGFEIERSLETVAPVVAELSYEEIVIDPENVVPKRPYRPLPAELAVAAATLQAKPVSTRMPPKLRREQFAVVDANLSTVAHGLGYMEAHVRATAGLLVVPATEAA